MFLAVTFLFSWFLSILEGVLLINQDLSITPYQSQCGSSRQSLIFFELINMKFTIVNVFLSLFLSNCRNFPNKLPLNHNIFSEVTLNASLGWWDRKDQTKALTEFRTWESLKNLVKTSYKQKFALWSVYMQWKKLSGWY